MLKIKSISMAAVILLLAITLGGCSPDSGNQPAVKASPAPAETAAEPAAEPDVAVTEEAPVSDPAVSELAGTAWRLVSIQGMDDSTDAPSDRSLYTLEFSSDGNAAMRADCNRGMGSWSSESPGQLQFGLIAATRAMCPPESLSEKYLAQFEWVRSYVLNEGHLFLATMADGAIIEFEPVELE